jgi:hypothetical protein
MGRVLKTWQGTPYYGGMGSQPMTYTYDLLGDLTSSNIYSWSFSEKLALSVLWKQEDTFSRRPK